MSSFARRSTGALLLASLALALVPAPAQAWAVHAPSSVPDDVLAAWTTGLVPQALPTADLTALPGAAACALGDVNGDGIADLAVTAVSSAGAVKVEARAGPDFDRVLWRVTTRLDRVLECAPDLDLDGTLDPIIRTLGETTATTAGAAADEARSIVQQTLDGANGEALVGRVDPQTATGATADGLAAAQNATSVLLPAAEGALALLQGSASQATAMLPVPLPSVGPLPMLDNLTATATQAARLDILDVTGAVTASIEIDQAGVEPLALAPVQLSGALPDVAVLSQVTGPVQQAATGVPQLALYAADGTVAWTTQLPAIAGGVPMLVPNAGDLNLDGVGDLIVTTVPDGVQAAAAAAYSVVSGVDGSVLFDSGDAVAGLLSALPLGDLPAGPALLEASLAPTGGALSLSALGGNGQVLWTTTVDRLAKPVNAVLDPYSGDILGFTDLSGDGVADIAVAASTAAAGATGDLRLQAIDGVNGDILWNTTLPDVGQVVPVVIGASQVLDLGDANEREDQASSQGGDVNRSTEVADLPGLEGAVDGVEDTAVGQASMLLALGTSTANATLHLVDGVSGEVAWTSHADLAGLDVTNLTAQVAGDLTGDQVQDLLVTAKLASAGVKDAAVVAAVSGATGETVWSQATLPASNGTRLDFNGTFGPRSDEVAKADSKGAPGPAAWTLGLAVVGAAALLRRRRDP